MFHDILFNILCDKLVGNFSLLVGVKSSSGFAFRIRGKQQDQTKRNKKSTSSERQQERQESKVEDMRSLYLVGLIPRANRRIILP